VRICRFDDDRLGLVREDRVYDVTEVLSILPQQRWPVPHGDQLIANLEPLTQRIKELAPRAAAKPLAAVTLLSPVANPSKVVAAPVNYQKHLDEAKAQTEVFNQDVKTIDKLGLFLKATSSIVGPGEGVALRMAERRNDHEVELVAVIGRKADRVSRRHALDYVAGYTVGLDMTVRGSEDRSFRKSVDSYTVIGPWLVTADEVPEPGALDLRVSVNGELRQHSNTRLLVFDLPRLIEYASAFYTLYPGDLIMTGTPHGVGAVVAGDVMEAEVEGVGSMRVAVRSA
jgi:2,4-didehydro-3-deoxy-L-rhamnonate hydrolase